MNQNNDLFAPTKSSEVNIQEFINKYVRNWKWFILCVVISMACGYIYVKSQIPQYIIETDILVKQNKGSGDQNDVLKSITNNSSDKQIDNEIEILKSYSLMEKVVLALNLQSSYFIKNRISKVILYKDMGFDVELIKPNDYSYTKPWLIEVLDDNSAVFNGKKILLNHPVQTTAGLILITRNKNYPINNRVISVQFNSIENTALGYSSALVITPATKASTVLLITLEDANIERGKDVLDKLVEVYNQAGIDDKNITTANQLQFLKERIDTLAIELNSSEKNVSDYKSSNGITEIGAQSTSFLAAVQANDNALSQVRIQIGAINNLLSYLNSNNNKGDKLPSLYGFSDPTLLSLIQQLSEDQVKKEGLLQTVPETNPIISSINDEILGLKQTLNQSAQNLKNALLLTEQQLQGQSAKFESNIKEIPSKERGLIDVMREQEIKNTLFTFLLQKREETGLSLASTVADSRTINSARGKNTPVKPVKQTLYLIFLIMGIMVPFSVITTKELLNVKVRKRSDIERYTDTPIIADISQAAGYDPLVVVSKSRSMIAEQIRAMRSNLQYIIPEKEDKVLLFTSSISGEGKSFVSLNLGASLATTGKKVVILELDLRKPKLNVALGINNEIGISNYLIDQNSYDQIIKPIPQQENYSIITSGPNPPNPAELLLNGRLDVLIAQLKKDFDYIILDAPPVGLVTDAQILSKWANATFYVVRYNYTLKSQIPIIDDLKQKNLFNKMSIIFNAVDHSAGGYGYGYGYGYGKYAQLDSNQVGFFGKIKNMFSRKA